MPDPLQPLRILVAEDSLVNQKAGGWPASKVWALCDHRQQRQRGH